MIPLPRFGILQKVRGSVRMISPPFSQVDPVLADVAGNTSLQLYGEGFQPSGQMNCVFAGGVMVCTMLLQGM